MLNDATMPLKFGKEKVTLTVFLDEEFY